MEHGYIKSFYVEADNQHVVMTMYDPSEGQDITVRITKPELATMAKAQVLDSPGPAQTPTPLPPA